MDSGAGVGTGPLPQIIWEPFAVIQGKGAGCLNRSGSGTERQCFSLPGSHMDSKRKLEVQDMEARAPSDTSASAHLH